MNIRGDSVCQMKFVDPAWSDAVAFHKFSFRDPDRPERWDSKEINIVKIENGKPSSDDELLGV